MKNRIFLVGLFTMILMLALFTVAGAESPENRQPDVQIFPFHDVFSIPCDGFDVLFDDFGTFKFTTFFKHGSPDRFQAHLQIDGTVTHSVTGQSFKDIARVTTSGKLPLEENLETQRGVFFNINVPGKGVVTLAVGRITRDEEPATLISFVKGQGLEMLNEEGVFMICEGLADL